MPNAFGMIDEAIWRRDKEFRALPRLAQCTFLQLLSQRDVDCAGILTLHVDLLAKGCDELTPEDIRHDLKTLEAARFVYVDDDTDELLIRSYFRRVSAKSPNQIKSALKSAKALASDKLRRVLAVELRRIDKADATRTANEIDPVQTPSGTDTQSLPEPLPTPSERGTPSEPLPEPPSYSSVIATESPSVVGSVGEHPPNPTPPEPPRHCPKHMPHGTDDDCRRCGQYRRLHEAWQRDQPARQAKTRTAFWDHIRAAPCCDERGFITDHQDHTHRCPNHDWSTLDA